MLPRSSRLFARLAIRSYQNVPKHVCLLHTAPPLFNKVHHKDADILSLVPGRGRGTVITSQGEKLDNVPISRYLKRDLDTRSQELVVVSMRQAAVEGKDPQLVCKVVPKQQMSSQEKYREKKMKKEKKASSSGPQKEKNVPVSWKIGQQDLEGQKKQAILSVLGRGHRAIIQVSSKMRYEDRDLSDMELERRQKVVDSIKEICDECANEYKRPAGSIESQYTLYYTPRQT